MTEPWRDLLDAARGRLEMLEDDRRDLLEELDKGATSPDVPLRVQRPFDNLLLRFVAATDQTTDALILAGGLDPTAGKRKQAIRQTAARLSGELARDIAEWFNAPVRADAEDIRNLSTHHSYEKRLVGDRWHVQEPRRGHPVEPRDMASYADAVVAHARRLGELIPRLEAELSRVLPDDQE